MAVQIPSWPAHLQSKLQRRVQTLAALEPLTIAKSSARTMDRKARLYRNVSTPPKHSQVLEDEHSLCGKPQHGSVWRFRQHCLQTRQQELRLSLQDANLEPARILPKGTLNPENVPNTWETRFCLVLVQLRKRPSRPRQRTDPHMPQVSHCCPQVGLTYTRFQLGPNKPTKRGPGRPAPPR